MKCHNLSLRSGFTILEVIAVLIVLGILIAVAIPRFFLVPDDAAETALATAVVELNARENLAWGRWKSGGVEYSAADIKADLKGFAVNSDNTLITSNSFTRKAVVSRTGHTEDTPGRWKIIRFTD
ncbi:MAG TPA: prepilin-type N-terminal cleavage/methylation domain-containing protein [Deltaproteobacteria bacterium]|nr:prepilin-type N-terminal cleavage/methylation domain-containing protein [Deltaproteobacteria bacterium]